METIRLLIILATFGLMVFFMFRRLIPALIALPIMALVTAFVGGVQLPDIVKYVVGQGSMKLFEAYSVAMFGGMFSIILQHTKVAKNFIKKGAELSGDNTWNISVMMLALIILLFTTLGGLGAIIMVATIVLPILLSMGVSPKTTAGIFLLGISIGGTLNITNWALYVSVLQLDIDTIKQFAVSMFVVAFLASLVYISIQLYLDGNAVNFKAIILRTLGIIATLGILFTLWNTFVSGTSAATSISMIMSRIGTYLKYFIGLSIIGLFAFGIIRIFATQSKATIDDEPHWISIFSPIIPLLLILIFDFPFIPSFLLGMLYVAIAAYRKGILKIFIQSTIEGANVVMPAVILMFGIGMLLTAIMGPGASVELPQYADGWPVLQLLKPVMIAIIPETAVGYVVLFGFAAPLALYRGPLNVWGMGYGMAAAFMAAGMPAGAIMGLLLGVGQVQGISDPTNIQNIWIGNEVKVSVQKLLWNTLPYSWGIALIGLIISAYMFM